MRKILVVVDMQNDFIDGALANDSAKKIIRGICELIDSSYDYDQIICTLDTHDTNYMHTVEGKNLPVAHCLKMTNGWLINSEILASLDAYKRSGSDKEVCFVEKNTFGSRELPFYMIMDEDTQIDFVGTCTGICVINNVAIVKAYSPESVINVYEDLCACVTPESHNRAIEQMRFNHINIKKWRE